MKYLIFILMTFWTHLALAEAPLSLEAFVEKAIDNNLDLSLASARTAQSKAIAQGIRIPPPMASVSRMNMERGESADGWLVSQTIPFPTKVTSDYSARKHTLKAQKKEEMAVNQEVLANAKYIYFLVWAGQRELELLKEKKKMIAGHIRLSRSMSQFDTFAKIHLLSAESQLDLIENEIESAKQSLRERQALAAVFLNEDPMEYTFLAREPELSKMPEISSIEETPQVQAINQRLKSFEALETAGKSEWLPDFTVSYSHMEDSAMFPENNQVMVGITLPFVYFWQPSAKSNEASAQKREAELKLAQTKRNVMAEKVSLEKSFETLKTQLANLNNKILPNAIKRRKLFRNVAPRDLSSLQEHLETMISVPDISLQILSLKTKYEQAVASLAKYSTSEKGLK
jgi:outer membrane protein TolC